MAAKKIILQVSYPGVGDSPYKTVAFAPSMTVDAACDICALKGGLKDKKDQYGLCIKDSGTWLKSGDTLEKYPLQKCSGLEYKPIPKKTTVIYESQEKKMEIDFSLTGTEVLSIILDALGEPKSNEFGFSINSEADGTKGPSVDYSKPLIDQADPSDTKITVKKKSKIGGIFRRTDSHKGKARDTIAPSITTNANVTIFGVPLAQVAHPAKYGGLPAVAAKTIEYLEDVALELEGIFRISGNQSEVLAMKKAFDEGQDVNVRECSSPHVVAGLLKLYLRDLPEPLFPFHLYELFISLYETCRNEAVRVTYYKVLIDALPIPNQMLLFRLLPFLAHVVKFAEINKMAIHNVATVFGPNILRSEDNSAIAMIQGTAAVNAITCEMIHNYEELIEVCECDFCTVATALFPYEGKTDSEVTFKAGDVVFVSKEDNTGWWEGEVNGNYGFFPSNYVKAILPLTNGGEVAEPTPVPITPAVEVKAVVEPKKEEAKKKETQAPKKSGLRSTGGSSGGSKQKFLSDLEDLKKIATAESESTAKLFLLVEQLNRDVEQLKKKAPAPSAPSGGSSASLDSLQASMVAMQAKLDRLTSSNDELATQFGEAKAEMEDSKKQLSKLKTEEIALKRDLKILQFKCDKQSKTTVADNSGRRPAPGRP